MSRATPLLILASAVAFNLITLWPEVSVEAPPLNDAVMHQMLIVRAAEAAAKDQGLLDHWVPYWVMGYPVFHHYQHLPHVALAALCRLCGGRLDVPTLYAWTLYLLLALFPVGVYWSSRRLGFPRIAAALAGACAPLLATPTLFGFDVASYAWSGPGLFTQLWGMWLLPIAVAEVQHACRSGRRLWLAAALLAATLLSHTLYGYMAALSSLALVWVGRGGTRLALRGARLALIFLLAGLATAYFVVPRALDSLWLNRSVFEPAWKYDSFGHRQVLPQLFRGELLDAGRFPTLTLLMFVGLAVALLERRREQRFAVVLLLLWVSLYFGRATWGPLFDWLPASSEIHAHRFIAGVHMAALPLIGLGLQRFVAALVRYVSTSRGRRFALAGGLVALTLWPAARERRAYLGRNGAVLRQTATAVEAVQPDLDGLVATLRALQAKRPGRVYAGLPRGWGGAFRVGEVPMYSLLSLQRLDMLGHAYHTLSLAADVQYLFDENDPRHYDLFGVGYVVAPEGHPRPSFWQPLWRYGTWMLYSVPGSGFVSPVYAPAVLDGTKSGFFDAASRWLQRGDFGTGPACGTVSEQSFDGARYTVAASATTPCHLRFKTSFHPGWRATVDGRPSPTVPLMPGFTGVLLEPGTHHVTLEYRATPGRVWMAAAGLLVLALAARAGRRLTRVVDRAALRPASLVL